MDQTYYQNKIEAAELDISNKTQNLRRLEAQRNTLNTRGMSCHVMSCRLIYLPPDLGVSLIRTELMYSPIIEGRTTPLA